jgi:hypothetical protein
MVKSSTLEKSSSAYVNWGIHRTLREAKNVSRWSPWHAHIWMEEARNYLSLDAPFYSEYNDAATEINLYWLRMRKFRWFDEAEFWSIDSNPQPLTLIELI